MLNVLSTLNALKSTDIIFFICCIVAVGIAIGVYFLIPVINKKQYQEQRENLRKRENAFKANKKATVQLETPTDDATIVSPTQETATETETVNTTDNND